MAVADRDAALKLGEEEAQRKFDTVEELVRDDAPKAIAADRAARGKPTEPASAPASPICYFQIVETDNHGGDYPDEKFVDLPVMTEREAQGIADAINSVFCRGDHARRFWKVVQNGYKLRPGFEP